MKNMYGIIYKITNNVNGKIYIGLTTRSLHERFIQHCCHSNKGSKSLIHQAILKYGRDNFTIEQIDESETKSDLDEKEDFWINYYNSMNTSVGYNLKSGGAKGKGYKHTDVTKKIISESGKGKTRSEETKKHMSDAQKLVKHQKHKESTKQKMSWTHMCHSTSESTRQKISNSNSGKIRTKEMNEHNSKRQIGKTYMSNVELGIYLIAMPYEIQAFLDNGWIVGKDMHCKFISKKEFRKFNK